METRFSRHLGEGNEIEIEGQKFVLKPLSTKHLPAFFKAMKSFGSVEGGDTKAVLASLNDESIGAIQSLIENTLEKSFPEEWKADEEEVKEWGMKNMMEILPKIFEINTPEDKSTESKKKDRIMKRLKKDGVGDKGTASETGT